MDVSYIPDGRSEIIDHLAMMLFAAPTFVDRSGYFEDQNIDTVFYQLNEGLRRIRKRLGEEHYRALIDMSARMRAHFEADPEDKTEDSMAGRALIHEMEDLLMQRRSKAKPGPGQNASS